MRCKLLQQKVQGGGHLPPQRSVRCLRGHCCGPAGQCCLCLGKLLLLILRTGSLVGRHKGVCYFRQPGSWQLADQYNVCVEQMGDGECGGSGITAGLGTALLCEKRTMKHTPM